MKGNYTTPFKETSRQGKAWRTGGLKLMLALLCREFGKDKVKKELEETEWEPMLKF